MTIEVENEILQRESMMEQGWQLTILRDDPIATWVKGESRTHNRRFLSVHWGESSKATLSLQADAFVIEGTRQHHDS